MIMEKKGKWNMVGWNYRISDCKFGLMFIMVIYWIEIKVNLILIFFIIKDCIKIIKIFIKLSCLMKKFILKCKI